MHLTYCILLHLGMLPGVLILKHSKVVNFAETFKHGSKVTFIQVPWFCPTNNFAAMPSLPYGSDENCNDDSDDEEMV